jgi:D-sedoheptulose 7-phosphate isomerase
MKAIKWLQDFSVLIGAFKARKNGKDCSLDESIKTADLILSDARINNKTVWFLGNGGSAAICTHLSQDLINKQRIRSNTICDNSLITCMANDYGYESVYYRPLSVLASDGDVLIIISSSGNSKNLIACIENLANKNLKLITLSAFKESNYLWNSNSNLSFYLPTDNYGHAETGHQAFLHSIIDSLDSKINE